MKTLGKIFLTLLVMAGCAGAVYGYTKIDEIREALKGNDGSVWLTGTSDPDANTASANGDVYLNTTTFDLFMKSNDSWFKIGNIQGIPGENGINGTNGANGANGADGTTWLTGKGAPTTAGKIGDFYYDSKNNDIYAYGSNGWTLEVNFDGYELDELTALEDGVYTASVPNMDVPAAMTTMELELETIASVQTIKSLKYGGADLTSQSAYKIENNLIIIDAGMIKLQFTLGENNTLVLHSDSSVLKLMNGKYANYNDSAIVMVQDDVILLTLDSINFSGISDYEIIYTIKSTMPNETYSIACLKAVMHDKEILLLLDSSHQGFLLRVLDEYFSATTYSYQVDENTKQTVVFDGETIKFGDEEAEEVLETVNLMAETSTFYPFMHIKTATHTYVLNYLKNEIYDVTVDTSGSDTVYTIDLETIYGIKLQYKYDSYHQEYRITEI